MIILDKNQYKIYISEKKDGTAREIKDFIYASQVHGDNIYTLEKKEEFISTENDGIISKLINTKIWVLLADCTGIVIMWTDRYGIVHAGWKWLKNEIIKKALDILQKNWEKIETLKIYIWPSIRQCCYEVGEEFLEYFDEKYFDRHDWKLYFDMIKKFKDVLLDAWVVKENIEINSNCTACSWHFFSYRKQNNNQRILVAVEKTI